VSARPMRADACRNRERLLTVAGEVIARDGVDASLEDIARTAGVGIGTLYRHFPSRDALLEAVYRHNIEQLREAAEQLLQTVPADQALAEWMRRFVAYVAGKKGLAAHLKTVVSADSDLFAYSYEAISQTMRQLVAAAAASGAIRDDVEPADLLRALSGVCLMADQPGWQDQACRISQLLVDGLRYGAEAAH